MKKIYLILLLCLVQYQIFAQKLPDIQTISLPAPVGIKIDGKANEWNDAFAADNKRTGLLYSIANDDKNLYLILKSTNTSNTNKIMLGGITFTVNAQGKKRENEGVSITYPLINRANRNQVGRNGVERQGTQGGLRNRTQQNTQQRDSIQLVTRKAQLAGVKEIKISGFKAITDSVISIYNEHGLKAVASFNQNGDYVYELAIPLSLLDLTTKSEFAYQLKLNGLINRNFSGNNGGNFGGGRANSGGNNFQDLMSPTDFWGKYTLNK